MSEDAFDFAMKAIIVVCVATGISLMTVITVGFISAVGCF